MEVFWFFPTGGEGRFLGTDIGRRPVTFDYLKQIATAIDTLGYHGALLPTGRGCEEAWIVASALIPLTKHLKYLIAVRPGLTQPSIASRLAATFDRISEGRLLINVVTGAGPEQLAGDGIFLDHNTRYEQTDEFLTIWRDLLQSGEPVTYHGKHLSIEKGQNIFPTVQKPYPPIYFGGSSLAAQEVAAKHVDVYLTWGEPLDQAREKIESVRKKASAHGRTVRFGIRLHVIVRDTDAKAWEAADELIQYVDDATIAHAFEQFARSDSEGQRRMAALHGGRRDNLMIAPNLWAGVGLVRGGAGTALVGDGPTVAARMKEYAQIGIDTFVLSGYPHLEEAYCFAELTFPHLPLSLTEKSTVTSAAAAPHLSNGIGSQPTLSGSAGI